MKRTGVEPGNRIIVRSMARGDVPRVVETLSATPEFSKDDISIFMECIEEYLNGSEEYTFICAVRDGAILGMICYGDAPIAERVVDTYWIAVRKESRMGGIGKMLMEKAEENCRKANKRMMLVDTESAEEYAKARRFYENCGYIEMSRLKDYYAPGNDRVTYGKRLL